MVPSRLRPFGFFLAFSAMLAFVFHPNHLHLGSGPETSSHCCVCHTVPMGTSLPQAEQAPAVFVAYEIIAPESAPPVHGRFSLASPRGPPAA